MHVCVGAKLALLTEVVAVLNKRLLHVSDSHIDVEHRFLTVGQEKKNLVANGELYRGLILQ